MIGVIDYGMGNLYSVSKALERLNQPYFVSEKPEDLAGANGLILPGVGSFRDAMQILDKTGLHDFLSDAIRKRRLLLGICLGMQLLFTESDENGRTKGLGFLQGRCERFSGENRTGVPYKVPHMGWNWLDFRQPESLLLKGLHENHVYFVHSYVVRARNPRDVLAASDYFGEVPAVVGSDRVFGTQFHPEKSGVLGMAILKNYCALVESGVVSHE